MGNGNIFVPLDRVEELENRIQDVPLALLNGSWVREEDENGNLLYYRQDVEVKGLSADSTPMIFPKWAGEEPIEEELNAYDCLIGEPIITEGNIRFMANPMPQWSFTMVAKGAMAAEGQDIDAVAGLVAKMNELETEVDVLNRNLGNQSITTHGVNLINYTDINSPYICPNDGYILTNSWGARNITIYMCHNGTNVMSLTSNSGGGIKQLFVKKGAKLYVQYDGTDAVQALYYPYMLY